jgi:3',5'-cyclic AMP phosphodiesterase CpdA
MPTEPLTVLHASDLQCGKPFLPEAADALVRLAHEVEPDVIVLSGDLTQRAKAREFRAAKALIGRLPAVPVVTVPGNHDVPVYRAWERLLMPFRNWRRAIGDIDSVTRVDGATFVALGTAAPRRAIVNGRLDSGQMAFARAAFAAAPIDDVRCLVIHHHFVPVPGGEGGAPMPGAARRLREIEQMGADLVLGGHVHRLHLTTSRDLVDGEGPGVPLVACGTTTSRRGRPPEVGANSLTVVRVGADEVEVTPYLRPFDAADFGAQPTRTFPRTPSSARADRSAVSNGVA